MRAFVAAVTMWAGLPMAVPTPVPMRPDFSPAALSRSAGPELAASAPLPSAPATVVAPVAAAAAVPAAPSAAPLPFVAAERPLPAASVSDPGGAAFDGRAPGGALDDDFAALHAAVRAGRAGELAQEARSAQYLFVGGLFASRTKDYFGGNRRRLDALGLSAANVPLDTQGRRRAGLRAIEKSVREAAGPVVLIGHSRGGVMIHDWYRAASPELKAKVARLVLIQAPLEGTPFADWALKGGWNRFKARYLGRLLFGANLMRTAAEMTPRMRQRVLATLPAWAPGDLDKVYTLRTTVTSLRGFYERRRVLLEKLGVPDSDGIVPASSAVVDGGRNVLVRDLEHKHTVLQSPGWTKRLQGYRLHPNYDAGDLTEALLRLMFR